ncbi:MAG: tetratricopeptide repeat protein [Parasphingorhabdus sp.]|uniref:tetratricopeptide repeat protein n=1 Tax=Parasphingorhabdus sp. TaxID=2709688 RepID=UPI00329A42A0
MRPIRKVNAPIAAVFLLATLAGCSSSAEKSAESALLAQQYLDQKNYYEARKAIAEAITHRDDQSELHILKGRIALGAGKRRDAFLAYQDALSLESTNPEALQAVSQLGLQTGYLQDAEQAADTMLSFSPELPEALLTKGLIALVRRKHDKALDLAERILAVRPGDEAGTILKARTLALTGNPQESLQMLQSSATDENYSEGVDMTLIELYRDTSNLEQMKATFKRLIKRRPENMSFQLDYANTLYKSGDISGARNLVGGLLRDKLKQALPLSMVTDLWHEYDNDPIDASLLDFLAKEGSLESRIEIAEFLLHVDQPEQALTILRSVSSGFWPKARALYARGLYATGETEKASEMATVLLDKDETNVHALLVRARHHLSQRDFVKAVNDAQIVVRDNPQLLDGYLTLADIYLEKDDNAGAQRVYADAVDLLPQDLVLFKVYTKFLLDNGNPVRAVAAARGYARDTSASVSAWKLYQKTCEEAGIEQCKAEARIGEETANLIYAVDLPPGTPPTRGLFGRLK